MFSSFWIVSFWVLVVLPEQGVAFSGIGCSRHEIFMYNLDFQAITTICRRVQVYWRIKWHRTAKSETIMIITLAILLRRCIWYVNQNWISYALNSWISHAWKPKYISSKELKQKLVRLISLKEQSFILFPPSSFYTGFLLPFLDG
jgi:hypothetical protein